MSEELLNTIVQLFALLAKEDELDQNERKTIESFLYNNLNDQKVSEFLGRFDQYCKRYAGIGNDQELEELNRLSIDINKNLTHQQKIILILDVVEMILADGFISQEEERLFYLIGDYIKVSREEIEMIKNFLLHQSITDFYNENSLIVDNGENGQHNTHHIIRNSFRGFLVFLRLESVETYFVRYFGQLDLTLNGSALRERKTAVFPTGSAIRGARLEPIYYSDVVSTFLAVGSSVETSFIADNINFTFPNGNLGLRDIKVYETQGSLVGIMGASGSGKSTLLNVLNGNEKPSSGSVRINGIDLHKESSKLEGVIGFVPQDDLLLEDLTVYENLFYAAKLCFKNLTHHEIDELVIKTLKNLGLYDARHLKVGSPLQKTISGGQRKRLNIGLELLREPSILFVDEPTSGLSSRDSENIMDLLKELSLRGKLIFVVIHQPSSDIFKMFDRLLILDVGGYQIYYGNPLEGVTYFRSIVNMINQDEGECIVCGNVNPEQIFNIIETRVINEYGHVTQERKISPQKWNSYFIKYNKVVKPKESNAVPEKSLHLPSRLAQTWIFTVRDTLSKFANRQYLLINLLEAPLLAALLAYIIRYFHHGEVYIFGKNPNIPAFFFMSVIVAMFMGLTVSAEEILKDRKILKRESFLNLSRSSYLGSKVLILFTLSAIQTLTYVIVGNLILGIQDVWFLQWMVLFSASCFANILGLNISSAFNSAVTIYILIPILLIPQLLLSGVVVRFDKLNPHITTNDKVPVIGELMTSRWAFEALMVGQFMYNDYEKEVFAYDKIRANSEYKSIYYLDELQTELDYIVNNRENDDPEVQQEVEANFRLLQRELKKEVDVVGEEYFPELEFLNPVSFNPDIYSKTKAFIAQLKDFYNRRFVMVDNQRDKYITQWMDQYGGARAFEEFRETHQNEAIETLVKNTNDPIRIIKEEDRVIRKIYPVYQNASPSHLLDFREQFYVSEKGFAGQVIPTPTFNILMMWFMSIVLYIALYYDVLRKVFGN